MNKCYTFASCMLFAAGALLASSAKAQNNGAFKMSDMDKSVKPGTDFYRYANGGWMKAHPLTPEYSRFGAFDQLAENNRRELRELIEGIAKQNNTPGSIQQKIGDLFNMSMDSTRRNELGATPIKADLQRIDAVNNLDDFGLLMCEMVRKGVSGYFDVGAEADLKDSKNNLVQVTQGGLTLGQRDYYLDTDTATVKVRNAFKEYVVKAFTLAGYSEAQARQNMEDVLRIETAIAKASYSPTKLRDVEGNYHKMTFTTLEQDYPGIQWKAMFQALGFPTFPDLCVGQPEAIHEVERILKDEPLSAQKAYLAFHLIDGAANYLDDTFAKTSFDFYGRVVSGRQEQRPRWKRAVATVDGVLGMGVGKMYVEKYFPAAAKERMLNLVKNLQIALGERINAQSWMDASTKAKALEKLSAFYVKIGYPNHWRNYDALTIDPKLSFWQNMENATAFEWNYQINKKVNKPVDRDEWLMTPQTVNAYYNPTTNEICFPAGILQPPFFDMKADDAQNYGAIGVVIGHEMTHGFDDQGRQFDKDGNLVDWWSKADGERFNERAKVLSDFFDKIKVLPDLYANGKLTLGENLADHGGLEVAYQAFLNATAKHPLKVVNGFTPSQRFFLAYAHVWAQNIRNEQIRVFTKSDPHALGEWRVNGTLPHIDAWYKAFNIKPGDPLFVPKAKRVDIW